MEITPEVTQNIQVQLSGNNGNAFVILSSCRQALMRSSIDNKKEIWDTIEAEAKSGDYDHLIQTLMKWFDLY